MTNIVVFSLFGELAQWRSFEDPTGHFSCPGPSPSNIAGMCGAAMGMSGPRNVACAKHSTTKESKIINWPVSVELLKWQQQNDYQVLCALKSPLRRTKYNVNGFKMATSLKTFRIQQTVMIEPLYRIAICLKTSAAALHLANSLKHPIFSIFLGASFCRGFIKEISLTDSTPDQSWAVPIQERGLLNSTPLSCHVIKGSPRLIRKGYWDYENQSKDVNFVKGYVDDFNS